LDLSHRRGRRSRRRKGAQGGPRHGHRRPHPHQQSFWRDDFETRSREARSRSGRRGSAHRRRNSSARAAFGRGRCRSRPGNPRFAGGSLRDEVRAWSRAISMAKKKSSASARVSPAKIRADEARFLMNTYRRPPVVFTHGRGCRLYDSTGRAYLDFLGGIAVNALGHAHPRLVRVIRREAARAIHISNLFHNPYQAPLARKLAAWSGLDRVFFTNSGTEAIEGALKLARAYSHRNTANGAAPKTRILALENSFHGRTFGAVSI